VSNPLHPIQRWLGRLFPTGAERSDLLVADLQSQRTRLEAVVTSMRDGILVTDSEGLIRLVNPAFCRMLGITGEVEEQPVASILGDREALERLVANLLDNGIKYNRNGGRLVKRLFADDDAAVLEVEDSGICIPADSLTRVFERFYRVDKGRSRSEGGTGLGLAIVKHVAQLHGGRVEVESHLGEGSVFRVFLPRWQGRDISATPDSTGR
jgi:two-component system phosphate regulon sensor histidine kinase PhoR